MSESATRLRQHPDRVDGVSRVDGCGTARLVRRSDGPHALLRLNRGSYHMAFVPKSHHNVLEAQAVEALQCLHGRTAAREHRCP